jgi:peroxiredoxin
MKRITLISLLVIITGRIYAANEVTITGRDTSYAGEVIVFNKYSDRLTNSEIELSKCTVGKDGSFMLSFRIDEITFIYANIGAYKVHLYAEPGKTYEIVLPQKQDKTSEDFLNPYYDPTVVHLGTVQYDENELNILIRMFNDAFQPYYNKHIIDVREKNDFSQLDKDIARLDKPFSSSNNRFFNDYRKYRYGLLRYLAYQQKSKSISDEYFKEQPVLYNNPAYMELFSQVYDKYFYHFSQTAVGKQLGNNITTSDLSGLRKTLASDDVIGKYELLNLVILKGLYDEFYDDNYSRSALLAIVDSFITGEQNPHLKQIAQSIRKQTTRLLVGYEPPEFELYDRDSNLVSLKNFKGKYVYLNFCSCYSYTCLNEFSMLSMLNQKYSDRLEIITVIVDNDVNVLNSYLSRSKYNWKFLYYGHQSFIIQDYDIRAFPTYYLIDPEGKLAISPAPSPGEEFEARFFAILRSRGEI